MPRSILLFALLVSAQVLAGCQMNGSANGQSIDQAELQAGVNALGRGNYPKALGIFKPMAESGDWNAQGFLAHTYRLMENNVEAYAWYHATARCGSIDAGMELDMLTPKLSPETIERGKTLGDLYFDKYCR